MRVFIDTNIYKKLFEGKPSKGYFDSLEKLVKNKKFTLVLPKIIFNEVYREVVATLKKVEDEPKLTFLSEIFGNEDLVRSFKITEEHYKKRRKLVYRSLVKKNLNIKKDMTKRFFGTFRELTEDYPDSQELIELARNRKSKRQPPGKEGDPLGDQLAWEILLKNCADDDLIIVSSDGDWQDMTDPESKEIHPILAEEWQAKSEKKIELIKDLGSLIAKFSEDFKKPEEEIEKEKIESTVAPRLTWPFSQLSTVTYTASSPASTNSYWVPASGISSATTSTSGTTSGWSNVSSNESSWSALTCSKCGRVLSSSGPYFVQNGLTFCTQCASTWGY